MSDNVKLRKEVAQLQVQHADWITLGYLRELVRRADIAGWPDSCLVSHSKGGRDHPRLRDLHTATHLVITGPS